MRTRTNSDSFFFLVSVYPEIPDSTVLLYVAIRQVLSYIDSLVTAGFSIWPLDSASEKSANRKLVGCAEDVLFFYGKWMRSNKIVSPYNCSRGTTDVFGC